MKAFPLYPTYKELVDLDLDNYPSLSVYLKGSSDWKMNFWSMGRDFLKYIGRNKSEHTYIRFRSEIEKFLLWSFLIHSKPINELKKTDILLYADFYWKPPGHWIGFSNVEKFQYCKGVFQANTEWRPYRITNSKGNANSVDTGKQSYRPSQQSMSAMFTGLNAFFNHLIEEDIVVGNPIPIAKKDCRYLIRDSQVKDVKRLTNAQWNYMLRVANELADLDPKYERSLFLVSALKTLFLRISELSDRENWMPIMGHFWEGQEGNWWLKIYGKGRKLRDVSVPPSFLGYLKRYRLARGLSPLPSKNENHPIVAKIRGAGGMTSRQLFRVVQEVFDLAYIKMESELGAHSAQYLKEASTHWLRHTGASQEIERGRPLKDLSEDLGHQSMATTDMFYIQTDDLLRAESGEKRDV